MSVATLCSALACVPIQETFESMGQVGRLGGSKSLDYKYIRGKQFLFNHSNKSLTSANFIAYGMLDILRLSAILLFRAADCLKF